MMKRMLPLFLCFCLLAALAPAAADEAPVTGPVFRDGLAQPILAYTDARNSAYTNEGSDILRFCVYVETDYDTDGDGRADLVEALVQVPRAAAEGRFKAATIYDPTPYGAGTVEETGMDPTKLMNPVPFDYGKLYEPGEKRTPAGVATTLDAAEAAENESWNYKIPYSKETGYGYMTSYDYYLVRGFAVVEAGGIGTYGSEGFELCGFDLERDAHKAVVEWIAGDRVAYTDPYYDIEIRADWSNGNVAMTGCSYGGTLPFEVATTGVKGLKTIIPFAGIASWYDYTNYQGATRNLYAAYASSLASYNSGGSFLDDDWTVIRDDYASFLWQLWQDQQATNGDYADIWASRDYTLDVSRISCSALIVHGLNDFNVTTKQFDLMARAFAGAGQEFRLVLHQDGHNNLDDILVDGELWQEIMNKWLSHYLYGVDNGIENMPAVTVQSNVDGSFRTYGSWREFDFETFAYDQSINPDNVSHVDTAALYKAFCDFCASRDDFGRPKPRDEYYIEIPESACASYVFDLPEDFTVYGVPEIRLRMSTRNTDLDNMAVSAALVDYAGGLESFKAFVTKPRLHDCLPTHTIGEVYTGVGLPRTKVKEYVQSNATVKLVTFGCTDLKNYGGGYEGKDYTRRGEPMQAGEYYDYTIYLQPTVYTFRPGHRAAVVITAWDPYSYQLDEKYNEEVNNYLQGYSFNIDNETLEVRFPVAKDASAPAAE